MTSIHTSQSFKVLYFGLVTGNVQNTINSASTGSAQFNFPSITGPTGSFLSISTATSGVGIWSTNSSLSSSPTPRNDYYRTRTNEILNINVLTGFSGNTGGTDVPGIGPTGTTLPITNVNIVKNVTRGSLTSSGLLGGYTYQSEPRFTGRDYFSYTITDSSGVTSTSIGSCTIDVVASGVINSAVGISGTVFISDGGTAAQSTLKYYRFGSSITMFNSSFIINDVGTNREDNLVYYSDQAGSPNVYFYDYLSGITSTIDFSGLTITPTPTFSSQVCTYYKYNLFIYSNNLQLICKFVLCPYTSNGVTGYQKAIQVSFLSTTTGYGGIGGDMVYDTISNTLLMKNSVNNPCIFDWKCPTSAFLYRTLSILNRYKQITFGYNHELIGEQADETLGILNRYTTAPTVISGLGGINDMGEYINEFVS